MKRLVDLSHAVERSVTTYPGLPPPEISDYLSREASRSKYAAGTEFQIGRIDMVGNTGTYVDSPFHRFASGADLSELALESVADREGVVVDAGPGRGLGPEALDGVPLAGRAVLIRTGWDSRWGTPGYFEANPFLSRAGAERLASEGAAIVGIDSVNIDDMHDGTRPAHTILLGAGIPIVEHLCRLDLLPKIGFRFFAVPVKVKGLGTFPVRAFASVDEPG